MATDIQPGVPEVDVSEVVEGESWVEKTLADSQAEAILLRNHELRNKIDDVLGILEADTRCDPGVLREQHLDELDDVIGDLMLFAVDLRRLEPRGETDG